MNYIFRLKFILVLFFVGQNYFVLAQNEDEKLFINLNNYLNEFKRKKIDTYLILEESHSKYDTTGIDSLIAYQSQIYIFSKQRDKVYLQKVTAFEKFVPLLLNNFQGFKLIKDRKSFFKAKDDYSREIRNKRKIYFLPSSPTHDYISLSIYLPQFENNFEMLDEYKDPIGFTILNQPWFIPLKQITDYLQKCISENEKELKSLP